MERTTEDQEPTYTTHGDVRGSCGHEHRSIETAARCVRRDHAGCRTQGGYSDRDVVRSDGQALGEDEREYAYSLAHGEAR